MGDTIIIGSDEWTARVWSVSHGTRDAVLACHAGPITSVEYCAFDKGIVTGPEMVWCVYGKVKRDSCNVLHGNSIELHNAVLLWSEV